MKPFYKAKLLKPLIENIELTEGEWSTETNINFYIPINFNPDEFFEGLNLQTNENDDYINLYLNYDFERKDMELFINYVNESGYKDGYQDFGIEVVEWDKKTDEHLKKLLKPLKDKFLKDMWNEFSNILFDDSSPEVDMILEEDWWFFKKGDEREDIWHWFDKQYSKGIYSLIYNGGN